MDWLKRLPVVGPWAAAMAAARDSSGKSATKLVNVIAAASRVHFTRSSRS
jgi:hypothetical protein